LTFCPGQSFFYLIRYVPVGVFHSCFVPYGIFFFLA
jgi:hypothetical protein